MNRSQKASVQLLRTEALTLGAWIKGTCVPISGLLYSVPPLVFFQYVTIFLRSHNLPHEQAPSSIWKENISLTSWAFCWQEMPSPAALWILSHRLWFIKDFAHRSFHSQQRLSKVASDPRPNPISTSCLVPLDKKLNLSVSPPYNYVNRAAQRVIMKRKWNALSKPLHTWSQFLHMQGLRG